MLSRRISRALNPFDRQNVDIFVFCHPSTGLMVLFHLSDSLDKIFNFFQMGTEFPCRRQTHGHVMDNTQMLTSGRKSASGEGQLEL